MIASPSDHRCPPSRPQTGPADPHLPVFQAAIGAHGSVYVKISGDLDVTTVPMLTDHLNRLAELGPAALIFDLAGVGFLDCAAARQLAGTAAFLPPGRPPVLTSVRPQVRRLLELTGLSGIMQIAD